MIERIEIRVEGAPEVTLLHVADTHMTGRSSALVRWLSTLPERLGAVPDLVVGTGDFIEDNPGIHQFLTAISALDARVGKFYVLGSHDYLQSSFKPITRYFSGKRELPTLRADTARLERGLQELGWTPLLNREEVVTIAGKAVRLSGVDDPYIKRHRTEHIKRRTTDDLAIGIMHAPELVSEWALNDFDLVLAGHTHGGQVRIPLIGALVTNSSLPASLAMGLRRIGSSWLFVSAGLGTSRYAPIRFLARPRVTLLEIRPTA